MSAASPEVRLVCEGASRRSLCHGLGRMVNNLIGPHEIHTLNVRDTPILHADARYQCANVMWPDLVSEHCGATQL